MSNFKQLQKIIIENSNNTTNILYLNGNSYNKQKNIKQYNYQ